MSSFLSDMFSSFYDVYQDQRDFRYQKDLQQEIFNREDNAIQRRMADLKAAGLNPNLAAGSAAQAGSVVGRSSSKDVSSPGSLIDFITQKNQIERQKQELDLLSLQKKQATADLTSTELDNNQKKMASDILKNEKMMSDLDTYYQLGLSPLLKFDKNGVFSGITHSEDVAKSTKDKIQYLDDENMYFHLMEDSPFIQTKRTNLNYLKGNLSLQGTKEELNNSLNELREIQKSIKTKEDKIFYFDKFMNAFTNLFGYISSKF